MYHPTTRVLAVLALLQLHRRMTGSELARKLEVNTRTVRDYITMLQDLGAPIVAERGRHGAYVLEPGFKLPPLSFTGDETLALAMGLLAARHFGLSEVLPAAESAHTKLERAASADLKGGLRALIETVTLDLSTAPLESLGDVVLAMSNAAQARQRIHMRYRSGQSEETERDFDPYGLACYRGKWYIVGACGLRDDLRTFRLDRVLRIDPSGERFERPAHFDALAHVVRAIATMPRKHTFELVLRTDLRTAQHEVFDLLGVLEPEADGVVLRGSVEDLDWLAQQISRFPFDFVVRKPEELRHALQRHAERLMQMAAVVDKPLKGKQ